MQRLEVLAVNPAARQYYVRWAESWAKAHGHQSPERTHAYFDAPGRSAHVADWQFRQAVDAARILACECSDWIGRPLLIGKGCPTRPSFCSWTTQRLP